jgi:hypothetical protein
MLRRHRGVRMRPYVEHSHTSLGASPIFWVASWRGVRGVWTMKEERFDILITCALATGRI